MFLKAVTDNMQVWLKQSKKVDILASRGSMTPPSEFRVPRKKLKSEMSPENGTALNSRDPFATRMPSPPANPSPGLKITHMPPQVTTHQSPRIQQAESRSMTPPMSEEVAHVLECVKASVKAASPPEISEIAVVLGSKAAARAAPKASAMVTSRTRSAEA